MSVEQPSRRTALYDRHVALGARMAAFAGFEMPMWYEGIIAEHHRVRRQVGIFDLSHMGEIYIDGREAFDLVQWLTCNDIRRIGDGQCQYTLFPTPEAGVVDDLIAYQINPESYMLVVNASNIAKDHEWILRHNRFDCTVTNRSDDFSLIAIQGPATDKVLLEAGFKNIATQAAFTFRTAKVDGRKVTVAGTGYTGERGFELIVPNEEAEWLWDRLVEAGAPHGLAPIGLGARDTLRLEMAYSLYGHELSDDISVLEANLLWTVRWGPDFLGKAPLLEQFRSGARRLVVGIIIDEKSGAPRNGAPVFDAAGREIGLVTSGSHSPSLDKAIALGLLETSHTAVGSTVFPEVRGKKVQARVCETPFYTRKK